MSGVSFSIQNAMFLNFYYLEIPSSAILMFSLRPRFVMMDTREKQNMAHHDSAVARDAGAGTVVLVDLELLARFLVCA